LEYLLDYSGLCLYPCFGEGLTSHCNADKQLRFTLDSSAWKSSFRLHNSDLISSILLFNCCRSVSNFWTNCTICASFVRKLTSKKTRFLHMRFSLTNLVAGKSCFAWVLSSPWRTWMMLKCTIQPTNNKNYFIKNKFEILRLNFPAEIFVRNQCWMMKKKTKCISIIHIASAKVAANASPPQKTCWMRKLKTKCIPIIHLASANVAASKPAPHKT